MDCNWQKMPSTIAGSFGGMASVPSHFRRRNPPHQFKESFVFILPKEQKISKEPKTALALPYHPQDWFPRLQTTKCQ